MRPSVPAARAVAGLALALALSPALLDRAAAAGGPVAGAPAGGGGVIAPGLPYRIVTVRGGDGLTVVLRVSRLDGRLERWHRVRGRYTVAAAAGDGAGTGLAADGRTLVLAPERTRFPARRTRFAVLDPRTLRERRPIALRGDFALDAIAPDGSVVYLVEHSAADPADYRVRAYDVGTRSLRRRPVVDPDEASEPMRGAPLARAESRDGRWAYTLYDGMGEEPFVHALDTVNAAAVCVDLPGIAGRDDLWTMRLRTSPSGHVVVHGSEGPLLTIHPRTFAVRPAVPAVPRGPGDEAAGSAAARGGVLLGAAGAGVLVAALVLTRRGRPRRAAAR